MRLADMAPRHDERLFATGMTGSGKSTLTRALIACLPRDEVVIIVDSKPDWEGREWWDVRKSRGNLPLIWGRRTLPTTPGVYLVRPDYPAHADARLHGLFLRALRRRDYKRKPITFVLDEFADLAKGAYAPDALAKLLKQGRAKNVRVLMGTQRPAAIPLIGITEANKTAVFALKNREDRKRLAEWVDPTLIEKPRGKYSFWWCDGSSDPVLIEGGVPRELIPRP